MNEGKEPRDGASRESASDASMPHVLLVEDDSVSAAFLGEAIAAIPAQVATATTLTEAVQLATTQTFDLWLIDAHLPDGHGIDLLAQLRAQEQRTPAIAHTAETAKSILDALIDAGFEEVLIKPLSVAAVQGAVRRFASAYRHDLNAASSARSDMASTEASNEEDEVPTDGKIALWYDETALRALNGNEAHLRAMRGLFRNELPPQSERIAAAIREHNDVVLRKELHKLIASASFVGAARLEKHARDLQARLDFEHAQSQLLGTMIDTLNWLIDHPLDQTR
jgi:CheY-like chemotaxis protein/HPt (histidine-containing phosphotransfer) domain-containing protein